MTFDPTVIEPQWLSIARRDIGNSETLGPNDSPFIRSMLERLSALWLRGQPWCGGAVANWISQCGLGLPKNWFRAKAWLEWGVILSGPCVGAVVVFERERGGHVGFVVGRDTRGRLLVLGGNQGDMVKVSPFDVGRAVGYRWPEGINHPAVGWSELPVLAATGPVSTNEA